MRSRQEYCLATALWIWIAFFAVFPGSQVFAAKGLSRAELIGYSQWLQALHGPETQTALYPSGLTQSTIENESYGRRLSAARALLTYDESLERAWNRTEFATEIQCLNNARASCEILDFHQAIQWYRTAARARGSLNTNGVIAREMFATAIMTGDSLQVLEEMLNMVGLPRLKDRAEAIVLAYRHYLYERDDKNLGHLMEKVETQLDELPAEIHYWHAFSLSYLDRDTEALPLLETIARDARLTEKLTRDQIVWFVRALPDNLYLQDRRHDALRLYRLLAVREDLDVGRWARFQIANDLLLDGLYEAAEPLLQEACNAPEPKGWQLRACELARTVAALNEVKKEGVRYGTDGLHVQ